MQLPLSTWDGLMSPPKIIQSWFSFSYEICSLILRKRLLLVCWLVTQMTPWIHYMIPRTSISKHWSKDLEKYFYFWGNKAICFCPFVHRMSPLAHNRSMNTNDPWIIGLLHISNIFHWNSLNIYISDLNTISIYFILDP